jgi:hypothetical protein
MAYDNCCYRKSTDTVQIDVSLLADALLFLYAHQRELEIQERALGVATAYSQALRGCVGRLAVVMGVSGADAVSVAGYKWWSECGGG